MVRLRPCKSLHFKLKTNDRYLIFFSGCIINILHHKKQRIKQIRYKWSDEGSYKCLLHVKQRNFEDLKFLIPDFPNLELPIFTRDNYSLVRKRIRVTYALLIFFIFHTLHCRIHSLDCTFYTSICELHTSICEFHTLNCKFDTLNFFFHTWSVKITLI